MSSTTSDPADRLGSDGPSPGPKVSLTRRLIDTRGRSLRAFVARGVLINTAFDLSLTALNLLRGLILAVLVTRADYGIWGMLVVSLGVLARLKLIGISDKYIQQDEPDQELAFQRAFTIELLVTGVTIAALAALLPVIAIVYGQWVLVAPGLLLLSTLVADALQSPLWVYYRTMDFARQRTLAACEPVVGFVVAIALAALGAGYWSLALGMVVGAWAGAAVAIAASPYRLRWRYDRGSLRVYASFSAPIFLATVCSIALANGSAIAVNAHLGVAAVGALALSGTITAFTSRVDDLVSGTLYPAICAMQDRTALLRESFVKSNRLALMWAMPFGIGLGLFAPELVRFVLGEKWQPAVSLLQVAGIVAAIGHIGFNWDDYFRARSQTRPIAVSAVVTTVATLGTGIPLLLTHGLPGLALGIGIGALVNLAFRAWYLAGLFHGFRFLSHASRAMLPTIPAAALILLVRLGFGTPSTGAQALAEVVAYAAVTIALTWWFERALLREAVGYIFRDR